MLSGQRGNFFSMELLSEYTGALLKWLPFNLLVSDYLKKEKKSLLELNFQRTLEHFWNGVPFICLFSDYSKKDSWNSWIQPKFPLILLLFRQFEKKWNHFTWSKLSEDTGAICNGFPLNWLYLDNLKKGRKSFELNQIFTEHGSTFEMASL